MTRIPMIEMVTEVIVEGILPRKMVEVSPGEMEMASQTRVRCTGTMQDMVVTQMTDITPA